MREQIRKWIDGLPADRVGYVRVRAGETRNALEAVARVEWPATAAEIVDAVADYGPAPVVRLDAYAAEKGEHLRSKTIRERATAAAAAVATGDAVAAGVAHELTGAIVELVRALAAPVEALASMHREARDDAREARAEANDLAVDRAELVGLLERLTEEGAADPVDDPLRTQAAALLGRVASQFGIEDDDPAPAPAPAPEPGGDPPA